MPDVAKVTSLVALETENIVRKAETSGDIRWIGRVDPTQWTLTSDVSEINGSYLTSEGVVSGARAVAFYFVELVDVPDAEFLTDLVRSELQSDVSALYPPRPGQVHQTEFLLGPKALEDREQLSSEKDLFYEPDEDRMALLAVYKERSVADLVSGRPLEPVYKTNRFLLQQAQEMQAERAQIMETFGDPHLFLYGKQAEVYQYSGILLNTKTFQWKAEFLQAWDRYLRATVSRENKTKVYLTYDNVLREGFLLNTSISQSTELKQVVFSFSMFIVRKRLFVTVPMSSIEQSNQADQNRDADSSFEQQEGGNKLGLPLLYDASIPQKQRDTVLEKVNIAASQKIEPPYVFVAADTGSFLDLLI